jgi:hypothetical protein
MFIILVFYIEILIVSVRLFAEYFRLTNVNANIFNYK